MAHGDLPITIDADYSDDPSRPDVEIHQAHHDELHYFHNLFDLTDVGSWPDGGIPFWVDANGKFSVIDPAISGSPGPTGVSMRFLGAWSNSTAYVNDSAHIDFVQYNGQLWGCVTSNTNSAPASNNANWSRAVAGFSTPSVWDSAPTYDPGQTVTFGGSTYMCLTRHSNSQPPSANWTVIAAAGSNGVDGAQGLPGPQGTKGDPGPTAETFADETIGSGTLVLDPAIATWYRVTLEGNISISLQDGTSQAVSGFAVRIFQGAGAPWGVTWATSITWITSDGLEPTLPTTEGEFLPLVFVQENGEWMGFTPGFSGSAAPISYPALDVESFGGWSNDAGPIAGSAIVSASSFQLGNQRGGALWVEIERADSVNPSDFGLANGSGGGSSWTLAASIVHGTGTQRRRLALFVCRDSVTGPSAPITVNPASSDVGFVDAVHCRGLRTTGAVPPEWLTTAVAKAVANNFTNAGSQTLPTIALASPVAASSRAIMALDGQNAAVLTPTDFTVVEEATNPGAPVMHMWTGWTPSSFVTAPDGVFSINVNWAMVGTEMVQG